MSDPSETTLVAPHSRAAFWWIENVAVVVLAITSILTAWSAYQSTRWNGEQASSYGTANGKRAESLRMSTLAGQQAIIDVQTFLSWTDAVAQADTKLAVFIRTRMRPEFQTAFDAWLGRPPGTTVSTGQVPPGTPFDSYRPAAFAQADQLAAAADAAFEEAEIDNQRSDNYVLTTVLLAGVLFFAGIAPRFSSKRIGATLVSLAAVVMVVGAFALVLQPISFSI